MKKQYQTNRGLILDKYETEDEQCQHESGRPVYSEQKSCFTETMMKQSENEDET